MSKFYVSSGNVNVVCEKENPTEAALFVFAQMTDEQTQQLGVTTVVNQRGFDSVKGKDDIFFTVDLLAQLGHNVENWRSSDWI